MSLSLIVGVLLVCVAAAFVAAPFFSAAETGPGESLDPRVPGDRTRLEAQKVDAYGAIREAEFDYQMGKLSEADFQGLRDKYSRQAIEAIAALDASGAADARRSGAGRGGSRTSGASPVIRIAFCPTCGQSVPSRANFCPACGRSLREEEVA